VPGVRSRDMYGIEINPEEFFEHDPEVFPLWMSGAKSSWHVFPCSESGANKLSWSSSLFVSFSHLLNHSDLFHKQAGTGTS